jgi:hypothetical protein
MGTCSTITVSRDVAIKFIDHQNVNFTDEQLGDILSVVLYGRGCNCIVEDKVSCESDDWLLGVDL